MTDSFNLIVEMLPPAEYSGNARVHWSRKYKDGIEYGQAVFYCAVDKRNRMLAKREAPPRFSVARLDLTFVYSQELTRDRDNLIAMFKPGLDALVTAEVLTGDDMKKLVIGSVNVEVNKELAPRSIITLTEVSG